MLQPEEAFEQTRSFLDWYAKALQVKNYLEIGCHTGGVTARIADTIRPQQGLAIGVDIVDYTPEWKKWQSTRDNLLFRFTPSDNAFEFLFYTPQRFDLIYLDGSHNYVQVWNDIVGAIKVLAPNGLIVIHDTWPPNASHMEPDLCSDAYKVRQDLKHSRPFDGFESITLPTMYGATLLSRTLPRLGNM